MNEIKYRDTKGYVSVYDVAAVIGISHEQMMAWNAMASQGGEAIGLDKDGLMARKSLVLTDWYDGLWIMWGFRKRPGFIADWPDPPGKRAWRDAIHALPVVMQNDRGAA